MARKASIAYDNLAWKPATLLTASSSATGYDVANLASPARWQKWRSATSAANQNADFDFASSKNVTLVAMTDVVAHAGGTVKAQYWDGAAWQDLAVIVVPSVNPTGVVAAFLTTSLFGQRIRVLFTNTGAVSQAVEIGSVFIGTYLQPSISIARGYGLQLVDPSVVSRSVGGQRSADKRRQYWHLRGAAFDFEPEFERAALVAHAREVGTHTPFFFAINPDDPSYLMFYARFDETPNFQHVTVQRFGVPFSLTEDI